MPWIQLVTLICAFALGADAACDQQVAPEVAPEAPLVWERDRCGDSVRTIVDWVRMLDADVGREPRHYPGWRELLTQFIESEPNPPVARWSINSLFRHPDMIEFGSRSPIADAGWGLGAYKLLADAEFLSWTDALAMSGPNERVALLVAGCFSSTAWTRALSLSLLRRCDPPREAMTAAVRSILTVDRATPTTPGSDFDMALALVHSVRIGWLDSALELVRDRATQLDVYLMLTLSAIHKTYPDARGSTAALLEAWARSGPVGLEGVLSLGIDEPHRACDCLAPWCSNGPSAGRSRMSCHQHGSRTWCGGAWQETLRSRLSLA